MKKILLLCLLFLTSFSACRKEQPQKREELPSGGEKTVQEDAFTGNVSRPEKPEPAREVKTKTPVRRVPAVRKNPCISNLNLLAEALRRYRTANSHFPHESGFDGLQALREEGLIDSSRIFACPYTRKEPPVAGEPLTWSNCSYFYFDHGDKILPELPLVMELPGSRHPGFYYLKGDLSLGHVEKISPQADVREYLTAVLGHAPETTAEKSLLQQLLEQRTK